MIARETEAPDGIQVVKDATPCAQGSGNARWVEVGVFLGLLFFSFMASWWYSPHNSGFGTDLEVHRYIGMVIRMGGIPYVDVFDNKPPIIYLVAALVHPLGPWGMWLFMAFAVALSGFFLYLTAKRSSFPFPLLGPILFILGMRFSWILVGGGGHTRELAACLILGLFSTALWRPRRFWAISGVLATSIFFTQQNEILGILPLIALSFWAEPQKRRSFVEFALGSLAMAIPIIAFLLWERALVGFINDAFVFNMTWYVRGNGPFLERLKAAWWKAGKFGYRGLSVVALATMLVTYRNRNRNDRLLLVVISAATGFFLQIVSIAISGRLGGIYFLPLVPYFILMIVFSAVGIAAKPWPWRYRLALWGAGLLCLIFLPDRNIHPLKPRVKELIGRRDPSAVPYKFEFPDPDIRHALASIRGQRGQFFVMRSYYWIALYTDYDIIAPTKWIYHSIWNNMIQGWDPDGREFRGILVSLDNYHTRYVLDNSLSLSFADPARVQEWESYLKQRYNLIKHGPADEPWRFYERKAQS